MKKTVLAAALAAAAPCFPQGTGAFTGTVSNKEYSVFIAMDFHGPGIEVPGQELFGLLPGYIGDRRDSRAWLIISAGMEGGEARLQISNDYGSEDLEATLVQTSDSTFTLRQVSGSTLKIARNRKWVKLPRELEFKREKPR